MLNRPIDKETGKKKPITFFLWTAGIYIALFGIASQRYENRIDLIETRASAMFTQLGTRAFKKALGNFPTLQHMECPYKQVILNPV